MATLPGIQIQIGLEDQRFQQQLRNVDRQFANTAQNVVRSSGAMRAGVQNVAFQLQDFVVQVSSGTSAMRAFAQQAPQMFGAFGPGGAIIGLIASLLGGFGAAAFAASSAMKDAADSAKLFDATVGGQLDTLDQAIERYREMTAEVRELERLNLGAILREQESQFDGIIKRSEELADSFKRLTELGAIFGQDALGTGRNTELDASVRALIKSFRDGEIALGDFSTQVAIIRNEAGALAGQDLIDLDNALRKNTSEAVKLAEAMAKTQRNANLLVGDTAELTKTTKELAEAEREATKTQNDSARGLSEQQNFRRRQIAEQNRLLAQIAEETVRRGNAARFRSTQEEARAQEQAFQRQQRELERQAEAQQRIFEQPFLSALDNIQTTFADTFETIFSGGVTSFSDLATAIKDIFIRLAAEIAALMVIRPVLASVAGGAGITGFAGAASGATPSLASAVGLGAAGAGAAGAGSAAAFGTPLAVTASGVPIVGLGGAGAAGLFGTGASLVGTLGAGAAGALGGALLAPMIFGGGTGTTVGGLAGGGLGAAAGFIAGTALGGPILGAVLGGLGGGLLGGGIGSLFGGGGGQSNNVAFGPGALGSIRGTGAGAEFVTGLDQQLLEFMTGRQEQIVNAALATAPSIGVRFSKTPSANDLSNIARSRIGPAAQALGFNPDLIAGQRQQFTAEQQVQNLQTALSLQRAIEDFQAGPAAAQFRELADTFTEMASEAGRLGISGEAIAQMHKREAAALQRRIQLEQVGLAERVGAISSLQAALKALSLEMQEAAAQAQANGISTAKLAEEHRREAAALQRRFQLERVGIAERVGAISPVQAALQALSLEMQEAAAQAREHGISTAGLAAEHRRLAQELVRSHQAQVDALALSIGSPFEQLIAPLKQLGTQLEFSLLNPAEQAARAAADFRRIANEAAAGSTIAMEQLAGAGQFFIEQETRARASVGRVDATIEVQNVTRDIIEQLERARREAEADVRKEAARAQQKQIDTLVELKAEVRLVAEEIKRLRR